MERHGPDLDALNTYRFETRRLLIELPDAQDVDEIYRLVGGEDRRQVCSTLTWDGPDSRSDVEQWIQKCCTEPYGRWGFHWVIRDPSGELTGSPGQAVGAIGTRPLGVPGRADVGYWLGRPYWRQGVMSEALGALIELGVTDLAYAKIEASVFVDNLAGRRLVERAGFELEGIVRRALRKYGEWVDEAMYGLLIQP